MKFLRRFVFLALIVGIVVKVLQRFGIVGGGECTPGCACSQGEMECVCGHATCLAPAVA